MGGCYAQSYLPELDSRHERVSATKSRVEGKGAFRCGNSAKCSDWNKQKWQPPTFNTVGSKIPMHQIHEVICDYRKISSARFDSLPIQ